MPRFSNRRQTSGKSARSILSAQRISPQSARRLDFRKQKTSRGCFFTDLQRAFTEVDFFADGKKRKIVSRESADANSARFSLENGGTLSLKKLENGMMKFRAEFENAREVSMSFIMPNEFFAATTADIGGARFAVSDNSAKPPRESFENFGKITLRADTRENAFSISDAKGGASCRLSFGKNFATLAVSSKGGLELDFDFGSEKIFSPATTEGSRARKSGT